jgi:hypothetical protein
VCVGLSIYSIPSDNGLSIGGIIQAEKLRRMAAEEKERLGHVSEENYIYICMCVIGWLYQVSDCMCLHFLHDYHYTKSL